MPMASLGRSDIQVSRLALGSWRTYDRISREQGIRVMQSARDAGLNFLDDARYNDETGVNIDTEMSNLIALQNAYGANARVMTTVQQLMQTLLQAVT